MIRDKVKTHIKNYGSVATCINMDGYAFYNGNYYEKKNSTDY